MIAKMKKLKFDASHFVYVEVKLKLKENRSCELRASRLAQSAKSSVMAFLIELELEFLNCAHETVFSNEIQI